MSPSVDLTYRHHCQVCGRPLRGPHDPACPRADQTDRLRQLRRLRNALGALLSLLVAAMMWCIVAMLAR
jgi:uncharacterized paraquat-inducible protein A